MTVLRFLIDGAVNNENHEWQIRIHPETIERAPIYERRLQRRTIGSIAFPQPPWSDEQEIPSVALHRHLCTTSEVDDIRSVYLNIIRRDPNQAQQDMETFGRYLAQNLLNQGAWDAINVIAQGQPIELSICSHAGIDELARLPWEMMYGTTNFLVAQTQQPVAITRLICTQDQSQHSAQQPERQIELPSPLKVLFVIGADLSDARILPGAEYLSLLRRLEAQGILNFQSRILLAATSKALEDVVRLWRPSVIHFICHGGHDELQGGFLELTPEDERDPQPQLFAQELLPLLTPDKLRPLVILNACYSGLATTLDYVPLAVELIQGGLPMVVGMVGSVADRACRLFTRNFYETLLKGGSVVEATASGRRASFIASSGHQSGVDWIFPTLFMAEDVSPNITVDPCPPEGWAKLQHIAAAYFNIKNLLFCDRIVFIEAYERLINSSDAATGLKMLAVEAQLIEKSSQDGRLQFGKTRLLKELAARAVRDGHIPCVFDQPEPPSTPLDLGMQLINAINTVYTRFEFPPPLNQDQTLAYEFLQLKDAGQDAVRIVSLSPLTKRALQLHSNSIDHPAVIAEALCADMRALANTARQQYPEAKLLLLVDDVHRFGVSPTNQGALDLLLSYLLTPGYLLRPFDPIRVIFTYSRATRIRLWSSRQEPEDLCAGDASHSASSVSGSVSWP